MPIHVVRGSLVKGSTRSYTKAGPAEFSVVSAVIMASTPPAGRRNDASELANSCESDVFIVTALFYVRVGWLSGGWIRRRCRVGHSGAAGDRERSLLLRIFCRKSLPRGSFFNWHPLNRGRSRVGKSAGSVHSKALTDHPSAEAPTHHLGRRPTRKGIAQCTPSADKDMFLRATQRLLASSKAIAGLTIPLQASAGRTLR